MKYKVKSATNGTRIRTYRVSKRGKVRFRVRVKTLSQMESGLWPFPFYFGVFREADEPIMEIRRGEYGRLKAQPFMVHGQPQSPMPPNMGGLGGRRRDPVVDHARETAARPVTIIRNQSHNCKHCHLDADGPGVMLALSEWRCPQCKRWQ